MKIRLMVFPKKIFGQMNHFGPENGLISLDPLQEFFNLPE